MNTIAGRVTAFVMLGGNFVRAIPERDKILLFMGMTTGSEASAAPAACYSCIGMI